MHSSNLHGPPLEVWCHPLRGGGASRMLVSSAGVNLEGRPAPRLVINHWAVEAGRPRPDWCQPLVAVAAGALAVSPCRASAGRVRPLELRGGAVRWDGPQSVLQRCCLREVACRERCRQQGSSHHGGASSSGAQRSRRAAVQSRGCLVRRRRHRGRGGVAHPAPAAHCERVLRTRGRGGEVRCRTLPRRRTGQSPWPSTTPTCTRTRRA